MEDVAASEGSDKLYLTEMHVIEIDRERRPFGTDADHKGLAAWFGNVDAGGYEFGLSYRFCRNAEPAALVGNFSHHFLKRNIVGIVEDVGTELLSHVASDLYGFRNHKRLDAVRLHERRREEPHNTRANN